MTSDSQLDLTLLRELEQVLGEYRPGGTPTIFRHAGEQSHYVAVHEHSHRDLANNTAYGRTIQYLIKAQLIPDRQRQRQLARLLMQRAWHVFEGHACWMELWCMRRDSDADAALLRYAGLPADYQRAVQRFLPLSFLSEPIDAVTASTIILALAEFAMDHAVATLQSEPTDLLALAQALSEASSCPDSLIEECSERLRSLVGGPRAASLALRPNVLGEDRSPAAIQSYLSTARSNIGIIKEALLTLDETVPASRRTLYTDDGMHDFIRNLHPDIPADGSKGSKAFYLNVPTQVRNSVDTPIAVQRQTMPLAALKSLLAARFFGRDRMLGICSGHIPGWLDPLLARLPGDAAARVEARLLEDEWIKATANGMEVQVELTVMEYESIEAGNLQLFRSTNWEQFVSHVRQEDCFAFWEWVARQGGGQCTWSSIVPVLYEELIFPDHTMIPMPAILLLVEYGADIFGQVRRFAPAVDYFWRVPLSDGFHAIAVGCREGPGFVTLATGGVGMSDSHCQSFGFMAGDVKPPSQLEPLILGAIARAARAVSP